MIRYACWTIAIPVLLFMSAGAPAFAETAVVACKGAVYTLEGDSCTKGQGQAVCVNSNGSYGAAVCGNGKSSCEGSCRCVGNGCNISRITSPKDRPTSTVTGSNPQQKGKVGAVNVGGALTSSTGGAEALTSNPALTSHGLVEGGSTTTVGTAGSKAKHPTNTQAR